jgi:hypothetical protein
MKVDGSCHCGKLAFEAEVDPARVTICHCTDCQTLSGTAFRVSVPAAAASFRVTAGEPKIYVKMADSGSRRAQGFCGDCGTPIYATTADVPPTVYALRVGALKQRGELVPRRQIWHRSALAWVDGIAEMPAIAGDR